ncbi:MAG TPA: hypothetical protein VNX28_04605, partial [Gemmataceae bacterium]|nr:hypothetical protein [Gemmataceae bacterium]
MARESPRLFEKSLAHKCTGCRGIECSPAQEVFYRVETGIGAGYDLMSTTPMAWLKEIPDM